jgi:hypothetical protein
MSVQRVGSSTEAPGVADENSLTHRSYALAVDESSPDGMFRLQELKDSSKAGKHELHCNFSMRLFFLSSNWEGHLR